MCVQPAASNLTMAPYHLSFYSLPTTTSCARTSHSAIKPLSRYLNSKTLKQFKANGSKYYQWPPDHPIVKEHLTKKQLSIKDCFGLKSRPRNDTRNILSRHKILHKFDPISYIFFILLLTES